MDSFRGINQLDYSFIKNPFNEAIESVFSSKQCKQINDFCLELKQSIAHKIEASEQAPTLKKIFDCSAKVLNVAIRMLPLICVIGMVGFVIASAFTGPGLLVAIPLLAAIGCMARKYVDAKDRKEKMEKLIHPKLKEFENRKLEIHFNRLAKEDVILTEKLTNLAKNIEEKETAIANSKVQSDQYTKLLSGELEAKGYAEKLVRENKLPELISVSKTKIGRNNEELTELRLELERTQEQKIHVSKEMADLHPQVDALQKQHCAKEHEASATEQTIDSLLVEKFLDQEHQLKKFKEKLKDVEFKDADRNQLKLLLKANYALLEEMLIKGHKEKNQKVILSILHDMRKQELKDLLKEIEAASNHSR